MSNFSYCRFENTLSDLIDCYEHINDDLSMEYKRKERNARKELVEYCKMIIEEYSES